MSARLRHWVNRARFATARLPAPFYVVSHERSGTHFLINTLEKNALLRPGYYTAGEWTGPYVSGQSSEFAHIDRLRADWKEITGRVSIIKTHSDRDLFDFRYPKARAVYVLRDPRDTLVSFYYYLIGQSDGGTHLSGAHRYSTVSDFLRRPLSPSLRWANTRYGRGGNVAERWANHVKGWLGADDTIVVRYEELKTDFRDVLRRLSPLLSLELLSSMSPVGLHESFSILPRKGVIGDWRGHFTADDEALVREAVERAGVDWEAVTWRE
jgi:hypothetical protein